jgi:alpha-D-ribose 1-methylphosphonate 5-triphosphate synthase subunit PhnI
VTPHDHSAQALDHARRQAAQEARGSVDIPEIHTAQIAAQLGRAVDRVMAEAGLYDPEIAARAVKQSQGDLIEAALRVRNTAYGLNRMGDARTLDTADMDIIRRISGIFKVLPGGQILGPTHDYSPLEVPITPDPAAADTGVAEDLQEARPPHDSGGDTAAEIPLPRVSDLLRAMGYLNEAPEPLIGETVPDITGSTYQAPLPREGRLQSLARGNEGALLSHAYALLRGFGTDQSHFIGELRVGIVDLCMVPPELGFEICIGRMTVTECLTLYPAPPEKNGSSKLETGYALLPGRNEHKAVSMALLDHALTHSPDGPPSNGPAAMDTADFLEHCDGVTAAGCVSHLKIPDPLSFAAAVPKWNPKPETPLPGSDKIPDST